jgi:hypothetical protein
MASPSSSDADRAALPPALFPPLPPVPPPPLAPDDASPTGPLTQFFRDHNAALACQHLLQLSPREAAEELSAAFSAVDWAPHTFLLALTQWPPVRFDHSCRVSFRPLLTPSLWGCHFCRQHLAARSSRSSLWAPTA